MADNFVGTSNEELDRQIKECYDPELLRQLLKNKLEREGVLRRETDGTYTQVDTHAQQPAQSQPVAATSSLLRRIITAGGKEWLISGHSEEELYRMEMGFKSEPMKAAL